MSKKIFKALRAGFKVFLEENKAILSFLAVLFTATMLSEVVMRILGIAQSAEVIVGMPIIILFGSGWIWSLATHCIEAVKYSEEHKCDMKEAWKETKPSEVDEEYL